jgi:hypothetical protein
MANAITGNARLVVSGLTVAGHTINIITTAAINSIVNNIQTLTQNDINTLTTDINAAAALIKNLKITNTVPPTDLTPGKN